MITVKVEIGGATAQIELREVTDKRRLDMRGSLLDTTSLESEKTRTHPEDNFVQLFDPFVPDFRDIRQCKSPTLYPLQLIHITSDAFQIKTS